MLPNTYRAYGISACNFILSHAATCLESGCVACTPGVYGALELQAYRSNVAKSWLLSHISACCSQHSPNQCCRERPEVEVP
jgi:hypothetical protein